MRDELFLNLLRTSLVAGLFVVVLTVAAPVWNRHFTALWRKRLWCVLGVVLVLGAFFRLPEAAPRAVEITVPERQVVVTPAVPAEARQEDEAPGTQRPRIQVVDPAALSRTPAAAAGGTEVEPPETAHREETTVPGISLLTLAEIVWAAGAAVFLLWQLGGEWLFRRRVRRWGRPVAAEELTGIYEAACRGTGRIGPFPALMICPGIGSPQLRGLLRPKLLLPAGDYTETEARFILRHELTHWRSHDLWWKVLMLLAGALHWFNPAVWLLSREMGRDMERACDERVMEGADGAARRAYSEVLLGSLHRQRQAGLSTYFYGGKQVMKERLVNILTTAPRRRGKALALACAALLVCAVPLVACTQREDGPSGAVSDPGTVREGYALAAELSFDGMAVVAEHELYGYDYLGYSNVTLPEEAEDWAVSEVQPFLILSDGREVVCYRDALEFGYPLCWAIRDGDTYTRFAMAETDDPTGTVVTEKKDVLGHDGFCIQPAEENLSPAYYYCFKDGGGPYLMAPCSAWAGTSVTELDRDGDGMKELIWYCSPDDCWFYLWREGTLYSGSLGDLAEAQGMDWTMAGTSPRQAEEGLLPIRVQTAEGRSQNGLVRFTDSGVEVWLQEAAGEADAAIVAMANTYIQENMHHTGYTVIDSRITDLRQLAAAPDPAGSGQMELWSLAYDLRVQDPGELEGTPLIDYLVEDTVHKEAWLVWGAEGDSYRQPVLVVWRDAYGDCTLEGTEIMGTIGEDQMGSSSFCASEWLYQKLGVRARSVAFDTAGQENVPYQLQDEAGFSLYIPRDWTLTGLEQAVPADATRWCAGFWHDREDRNTGIAVYHVAGDPADDNLGLDLLFAAAADAGTALEDTSRGYSNLSASCGVVRQYAGWTAEGIIFRAYAVSDGDGGAWAVVTREHRENQGEEVRQWAAAITFRPKLPPFPIPTAEVYGLSGDDAAIYNAASQKRCAGRRLLEQWYDVDHYDLVLPCVTVLDSYPAEDGGTHYICNWWEYFCYDLQDGLANPDHPVYTYGGGGGPARFTISAGGVCTEVLESGDGEGWADSIRRLCGPKTELAEGLISGTVPEDIIPRSLVSGNVDEVLDTYLDYYFR